MTVVSGISSFVGAKKAKKKAAARAKKLKAKLNSLETNRQKIINPYEGSTDLSGMLTDYSGQMTNPMANLSVATQAAEMQIEEADISLANTLDTIRATGAGAGGATALAQAAMKSKKQVAASIEQQEVANERSRAAGEQQLQTARINEKKRIEAAQMSEAGRMQQLDASGKMFMYNQREGRETAQIERVAGQLSGAQQNEAAAAADATAALTGTIGSAASVMGTIGAANIANDKTFFGGD
jgi:hypothetical protein